MEGERAVLCITCTRSVLRDRNRHILTRSYLEDNPGFTEYVMERINVNEMALNQFQYMCHRCWVAGRRQQARLEQEQNQELVSSEQLQPTSVPTYRRVANTARHCLFHGCINQELHRVSRFIKVLLKNMNRQRAVFTTMTATSIPFPQLTEEDVILFSLGTYHLKLARSYVAEHLRGGDGVYNIELSSSRSPSMSQHGLVTENCSLIRGRILSRHVSNKIYYTYILMKVNVQGREAIKAYYCSCITGMRTLGACAHTVSIIWYLGVGRHLDNFVGPASAWDDIIIESNNTI